MINIPMVELDTQVLEALEAGAEGRAHQVLDQAALRIQARAMTLARVDTGAMRASIYVSGLGNGLGTSYGESAASAARLRPGGAQHVLSETRPNHRFERIIGVAVDYAYFVELRYPFLAPAVHAEAPALEAAWSELLQPRLF